MTKKIERWKEEEKPSKGRGFNNTHLTKWRNKV